MATTQAWSVHYTSSGTVSKVSDSQSGDAGPASGTQQVLIQTGATSDEASLVVIGQITYAKANAAGLKDLMGLSTTQAAADANQWILFSTANAAFSQIVAGIRSHDVAEEIALTGPFTLGASRHLDGYEVDAIRGTLEVQGAKPAAGRLVRTSIGSPPSRRRGHRGGTGSAERRRSHRLLPMGRAGTTEGTRRHHHPGAGERHLIRRHRGDVRVVGFPVRMMAVSHPRPRLQKGPPCAVFP